MPAPVTPGNQALVTAVPKGPEAELRIEAGACLDDMSGEPFPARVTLSVDGEQYRGCGQGIAR